MTPVCTQTLLFDITNSRYGSQSVSLQVDVQPSLPHWRLGNAKSGGRVFRQSHPPAWDALCAPKQDTANPNFPPLAQILRSLEQLHGMQYSMSITRTPPGIVHVFACIDDVRVTISLRASILICVRTSTSSHAGSEALPHRIVACFVTK